MNRKRLILDDGEVKKILSKEEYGKEFASLYFISKSFSNSTVRRSCCDSRSKIQRSVDINNAKIAISQMADQDATKLKKMLKTDALVVSYKDDRGRVTTVTL